MEFADRRSIDVKSQADRWEWLALVCALSAAGAMLSSNARNPPAFDRSWVVSLSLALISYLLIVARSYRRIHSPPMHLFVGLIFVLDLASALGVFWNYFQDYHDVPWTALLASVGLTVIGAWIGGQAWLSLVMMAVIAFAVYAAGKPPIARLPAACCRGSLTASIDKLERKHRVVFCGFSLSDTSPTDLAQKYDLSNVSLSGRLISCIPVDAWPAHLWPDTTGLHTNSRRFKAEIFPPPGLKSIDLTVTVPTWPVDPAVSVTVPIPAPDKLSPAVSAAQFGYSLSVSRTGIYRWNAALPDNRTVSLEVEYHGFPYSGRRNEEYSICDRNGAHLQFTVVSTIETSGGGIDEVEVSHVPSAVNRLTVDLYTPAQRAQNMTQFSFAGLPSSG